MSKESTNQSLKDIVQEMEKELEALSDSLDRSDDGYKTALQRYLPKLKQIGEGSDDEVWENFMVEYESLQRMEENDWEFNKNILKEKYCITKINKKL